MHPTKRSLKGPLGWVETVVGEEGINVGDIAPPR